jgi:Ran-binding protein 9/10
MLRSYGQNYGCGDTVGCGVDWVREKIFFTLNGRSMGDAFDFANHAAGIIQNNKSLYPVVGIDTTCLVRVNLTGPFQFDLQRAMSEQKPAVSTAFVLMKK